MTEVKSAEITDVTASSFDVWWSSVGVGFGSFYFRHVDGKTIIHNECMSKDFIKQVLCALVDSAELDCIRDENEHASTNSKTD